MVGWSRRGREDSERRGRWWASLTPQQRAESRLRQGREDHLLLWGLALLAATLIAGVLVTAWP